MKKYLGILVIVVIGFFVVQRILQPNYSQFLPNPKLTPGAIDPRVTQDNIKSTVCVSGYTKTVRPVVTYTSSLKRTQLDSGYRIGTDTKMRDYEEDHLIPLEVGGNPSTESS